MMNSWIIIVNLFMAADALKLSMDQESPIPEDVSLTKEEYLMTGPLTKDEIKVLEHNPLKNDLQTRLYGGSDKTFYFVGDSLVRNQFEGFCLLLKNKVMMHSTVEESREYWGANLEPKNLMMWGFQSCTDPDNQISAHFAFSGEPNTTALDFLMNRGPKPSVIYWDGGMWSMDKNHYQFYSEERFPQLLKALVQAQKAKAPGAKSVWFGAHKPCDKKSYIKIYPGLDKKISSVNAQAKAALQREGYGYVDGWKISSDRCDVSDKQGVHFNRLIFDELQAFFNAVAQSQS